MADANDERRQPLQQLQRGAGDDAKGAQSVQARVRRRGDEHHAIRGADLAAAQRRDQGRHLVRELLAAAATGDRPLVRARRRVAEKGTDPVRGLVGKDVRVLEFTGGRFHRCGVDVDDVEQETLGQTVAAEHAGCRAFAVGGELQAAVVNDDPAPVLRFRDGRRRVEVQFLSGEIGRGAAALLTQGPQPLQDLFDLPFETQRAAPCRRPPPNQPDSQRVRRVGPGIS